MLAGQSWLGLGDSLLISVVGLGVVMLELFLLCLFVLLLAKVGKAISRKEKPPEPVEADPPAAAAPPAPPGGNAIEMAAALAAGMAECGITPADGEILVVNANSNEP